MCWTDANALCESLGGHLATIMSADENDFVTGLISKRGSKSRYWLGGTDAEAEGDWKWVTGETWYSNWNDGEPSNNFAVMIPEIQAIIVCKEYRTQEYLTSPGAAIGRLSTISIKNGDVIGFRFYPVSWGVRVQCARY